MLGGECRAISGEGEGAALSPQCKTSAKSIDKHVGSRVAHLREQYEISQEVMAQYLQIDLQQFHDYENGVERISAQHLASICRLFNRHITWCFEDFEFNDGS